MDFELPDTSGLPQVEMPDFDFSLPDLPLHQAGNQPADADVPDIALGDPLVPVAPAAPVAAGAAVERESPNLPAARAFVAGLPTRNKATKPARYRALEDHRQARPEAPPWSESSSRVAAGGMSQAEVRRASLNHFPGPGSLATQRFLAKMRDEVPGFAGMSQSDKYRTLLLQTRQPSQQGRWMDRDLRRMADGLPDYIARRIKNEPGMLDLDSETDDTRAARRVLAEAPEDVRSDEDKYRFLLRQVRDRPLQAGLGIDSSLLRAAGLVDRRYQAGKIKAEPEFRDHSPSTSAAMEVLTGLPPASTSNRDRRLEALRAHNRDILREGGLPEASLHRAAFFFRPTAARDPDLRPEAPRAQALVQQVRNEVSAFDAMTKKQKYRALLRATRQASGPSDWPDATLQSLAGGISRNTAREIRNEPEFSPASSDSPGTAAARQVLAEAPEQERNAEEKYRVLMRHRRDHPDQVPRLTDAAMRRAADGIGFDLTRSIKEEPEFTTHSGETVEAVRVLAGQPPEKRSTVNARFKILRQHNLGLPRDKRLPNPSITIAARHFDKFDLSTLTQDDGGTHDDPVAGPSTDL